jgi:hypothetical protein
MEKKQDEMDSALMDKLSTLFPDERRHLLKLLEGGTILDCERQTADAELLAVFDECLNVRPHLLIEIGYNRVMDWMVTVWDASGVGIAKAPKIISTQERNRDDAVREAAKQLREKFLTEPAKPTSAGDGW